MPRRRAAARVLGPVSERARLVVTHGNGPQVGLLALKEDAYGEGEPYPLDVLDAESGGQIGYVIELELDNAIDHQHTVAVITRVLVDADDPAFSDPTKFIGPVYDEDRARELAAERGWTVKPDGDEVAPRRPLAPAPGDHPAGGDQPPRRGRLPRRLRRRRGRSRSSRPRRVTRGSRRSSTRISHRRCSRSGCRRTSSSSRPTSTPSTSTSAAPTSARSPGRRPAELRAHDFAAGSMGPKVEAVCRFAEATGGRGAIGSLEQLDGLIDGTRGTQVSGGERGSRQPPVG